jgi:hypothetical protein
VRQRQIACDHESCIFSMRASRHTCWRVRFICTTLSPLGSGYEHLGITECRISIANILIRKQELLIERYLESRHNPRLERRRAGLNSGLHVAVRELASAYPASG